VVDCEDLPLNISRETYQDTSLIAKLRTVITRRVIKMLEDEAKADPEKYNKWYDTFQNFLKEGTQSDPENKDALFRLLRFNVNYLGKSNAYISLEDYASKMIDGQNKIYFTFGTSYDSAMKSPFYEPFKGKDVPVLVLTN
jgi:HSP90 family molecular chaperone